MKDGWSVMAVLVCCLALSGGTASASGCEFIDNLEIETSFEFEVDGKVFTAGYYVIERTGLQQTGTLRIVEKDTNRGVSFMIQDVRAEAMPTATHLVFSEADGKHILHQIFLDSKPVGCQVVQRHKHEPHHDKRYVMPKQYDPPKER